MPILVIVAPLCLLRLALYQLEVHVIAVYTMFRLHLISNRLALFILPHSADRSLKKERFDVIATLLPNFLWKFVDSTGLEPVTYRL